MKKILSLAIGLLLVATTCLQADVTITVETDPPVGAGDIARVSVFASSTTGQSISGLNLPVDIGPTGNSLPPELSFLGAVGTNDSASPSVENEIGGVAGGLNTSPTFLTLNNTDAIVNAVGFSPVILTTADTLLFDLLVQVDPSATTNSFPVFINTGGQNGNGFSFNLFAGDGAEINDGDIAVNAGSVNITAIPEPTTLALFGFFGLAGFASNRRR